MGTSRWSMHGSYHAMITVQPQSNLSLEPPDYLRAEDLTKYIRCFQHVYKSLEVRD